MTQVSGKHTHFYKKVFPPIWYCLCASQLFLLLIPEVRHSQIAHAVITGNFLFMTVLFAMLNQKFLADLMDQAHDLGDQFLIHNNDNDLTILLSDIEKVSYTRYTNPPRISLHLNHESLFGPILTFSPPAKIGQQTYIEYAKSLQDRLA